MLERQADVEGEALPRARLHNDLPGQLGDRAVDDPKAQSVAGLARRRVREGLPGVAAVDGQARTAVGEADLELSIAAREGHLDGGAGRVAHDVLDEIAEEPLERGLVP